MSTEHPTPWRHLERKPGSDYQQLFVKGARIAARTLFSYYTPGEDWPGQSVEELAEEFHLSLETVREAIAFCQSDPPEIRADLAMEEALMEARGENDPSTRFHPSRVLLSPEERARIIALFRL